MIFACDRCGRRYSVPDERVQGRAFRVTCKACGNVIQVRPGAQAAGAAPAPARPAPPPAPAAAAPAPAAAARSAARPVEAPAPAAAAAPLAPLPRADDPFDAPLAPLPRADDPFDAPPAPPPRVDDPFDAPPAPPPRVDDPFDAPPAPPPRVDLPFDAPPPAPAVTAVARRPGSERGLSADEMAWMSGAERGPVSEPAPAAGFAGARSDPPADPEPRSPERGPGLLRGLVAAGILGVAAAGAVALFWPSLRPGRAPDRPPAVAAPAKPAPPPAAEPAPPAPAAPETAVAPETAAAPDDAPEPARAVSRARFEPGTVTVARVRKKASTLSKKDRKLLDLLSRKKDSAAPPEPVEALDLDTARSLDPAAVERVVAESQGAFSGCISRNARAGQEEHATLLLTVDATGAVSSAWIAEAEVSKLGLGRCLATAGRRLVFPSFEGPPVDVSVPLLLEAR